MCSLLTVCAIILRFTRCIPFSSHLFVSLLFLVSFGIYDFRVSHHLFARRDNSSTYSTNKTECLLEFIIFDFISFNSIHTQDSDFAKKIYNKICFFSSPSASCKFLFSQGGAKTMNEKKLLSFSWTAKQWKITHILCARLCNCIRVIKVEKTHFFHSQNKQNFCMKINLIISIFAFMPSNCFCTRKKKTIVESTYTNRSIWF